MFIKHLHELISWSSLLILKKKIVRLNLIVRSVIVNTKYAASIAENEVLVGTQMLLKTLLS